MVRLLTESECRAAMETGDFPPEIRGAAPATAIILTQSWCPQWTAMKAYLSQADKTGADTGTEPAIFYIEYDRVPWFEEFMGFKENAFNNREIPYVRYYRGGEFTRDSNYISLQGFLSRLGIEA